MNGPRFWIESLGLARHPEGGWFRETYRSPGMIPCDALPARYHGPRCFMTAIHFLLCRDDFSALHRLGSDELWHYYAGDPLTVHIITAGGDHVRLVLGRDAVKGERFQALVPQGAWFGAVVEPPGSYALVGCTVAPGFDFEDFEIGKRGDLLARYPDHAALIRSLTR